MTWQYCKENGRPNKLCIEYGRWSISKTLNDGKPIYSLWEKKKGEYVFVDNYESADEAKKAATDPNIEKLKEVLK